MKKLLFLFALMLMSITTYATPQEVEYIYIDGVKCQAKLVKGADGSLELTDYTPTAIQDVKRTVCPNTSNSKIYDLRGRQVTSTSSHRGIYIIGGKKVIR
jgi:hypothetical protein